MRKILLACVMVVSILTTACEHTETTSTPSTSPAAKSDTKEVPASTETSEDVDPKIITLDSATEKYFYGTWKVEKLLGFANSYNDASKYPTGQKFIGDQLVIEKDYFSSKGLKNEKDYQYELKDPLYRLMDNFEDADSFYRTYKIDIPNWNMNDKTKVITISDPSTKMHIPVSLSFFIINNDRLILLSEATIFELKKVN
ncbi:hypothetical protein [Saccharibacillus brassicae]|uniref:Lipocalin-like domain-containing protein n=1 Tax=Saccharibacillus brassicae TaxID=2583377 RepID=A0A4Y6UYZ9_SACBS|nr:hypothetical protein [Saccharibacillus brassicae]QDH21457.1 hypothetical protein FFV09_11770 [Saccharibacillus brassicae]